MMMNRMAETQRKTNESSYKKIARKKYKNATTDREYFVHKK